MNDNDKLRAELVALRAEYDSARAEEDAIKKKIMASIIKMNKIEWQIQYNDLPQICKDRECHYTCSDCHLIIVDD